MNSRRYIRPTFIKLTLIYYRLDSSCCVTVVFAKGSLFSPNFAYPWNSNKKTARQRRGMSIAKGIVPSCTPAVCYVF